MTEKNVSLYIQVSSNQNGPLAVFHLLGLDSVLVEYFDDNLGGRRIEGGSNPLLVNGIRYGWLRRRDGGEVDEVMVAKPGEGSRVLMVHGGPAIRRAVTAYLDAAGFMEYTVFGPSGINLPAEIAARDTFLQPLLSACITETQVAAILDCMEKANQRGIPPTIPADILATRRVVLAGPPNAGKSSLLNRLAGHDRAFVHDQEGATRDVVDELADLDGLAVFLGDMPGYAEDLDELGGEAWRRAAGRLRMTDAVLFVVDASRAWGAREAAAASAVVRVLGQEGEAPTPPVLVVRNKVDLGLKMDGAPWKEYFPGAEAIEVCSLPEGNARERVEENLGRLMR